MAEKLTKAHSTLCESYSQLAVKRGTPLSDLRWVKHEPPPAKDGAGFFNYMVLVQVSANRALAVVTGRRETNPDNPEQHRLKVTGEWCGADWRLN
jgi:hypothetical protein